MNKKEYHAIGVQGLSEVDMSLFNDDEKEESEFDIACRNKSMEADLTKALNILKDHWPTESGSDLGLSYGDVYLDLEKKLNQIRGRE